MADLTPECEHDFDLIGTGYYDGCRPKWTGDEFFCRRCLARVVVRHGSTERLVDPDPRWWHRTAR